MPSAVGQLRGLGAAAVHEHDPNADLVQDRHLFHKAHARRGSGLAKISPPALSTKVLPLYILT